MGVVPPKVYPNNVNAGMTLESLDCTTLMGVLPKV